MIGRKMLFILDDIGFDDFTGGDIFLHINLVETVFLYKGFLKIGRFDHDSATIRPRFDQDSTTFRPRFDLQAPSGRPPGAPPEAPGAGFSRPRKIDFLKKASKPV